MVILTLNCGSSSAKYQVYDWDNKEVMANGVVERIGIEGSCITHKAKGKKTEIESPCPTHKEAIELIIKEITDPEVGVIKSMDKLELLVTAYFMVAKSSQSLYLSLQRFSTDSAR